MSTTLTLYQFALAHDLELIGRKPPSAQCRVELSGILVPSKGLEETEAHVGLGQTLADATNNLSDKLSGRRILIKNDVGEQYSITCPQFIHENPTPSQQQGPAHDQERVVDQSPETTRPPAATEVLEQKLKDSYAMMRETQHQLALAQEQFKVWTGIVTSVLRPSVGSQVGSRLVGSIDLYHRHTARILELQARFVP